MFDLQFNNITDFLDIEEEDLVIQNLVEKYKLIQPHNSFLHDSKDDYYLVIDYIISLYFDKKEIPTDLVNNMKNNIDFKTFLLQEVKQKMNNIICDNKTILFKEIVSIINLLSLGQNYNIFTNYNFYSFENISKLFRNYEDYLSVLKDSDEKNFDLTFNLYVTLIETFNELCILNQTDIQRKKTISGIIDTLTETINIVKYRITLNDEKINVLNNILGKLLFYYAHVPFIDTENKDFKYIVDEYNFLFEKQTDGYFLSKNSNFGNTNINREDYYLTYLNNVTTLLLTLIYKIEAKFTLNDDFYDLQKFSEIIESYQINCKHLPLESFNNVNDFKTHLLNNFAYIYNKHNPKHTVINSIQILDELILKKEMTSESMNMIRDIILFSNDIKKTQLEEILIILIDMPKIRNDYFEFFKLSVIDIIILKFAKNKEAILKQEYIILLCDYIDKNKVASHLMSMYSKIYLSLALYYSYSSQIESQEISKDFYFGYVKINEEEPLYNEYKLINNLILKNYGKISLSHFQLEELNLKDQKLIDIGKKIIEKFFKIKSITLKHEINQHLADIISHIFNQEGLNNDTLNTQIESFISTKIFYGLVFTSIDGLCEKNCKIDDIGYEKVYLDLIDGYKLKFTYSNVYIHTFEKIYAENIEYIKQNINNLLISYIKSIPLYLDQTTNVGNSNKLEKDLVQLQNKKIIFIEIYLDSLIIMNQSESFSKTNNYFKEVAQQLNLLGNTYRTQGPRLGILLTEETKVEEIVEKIRKLEILYNNKKYEITTTIAVSWGNSSNIIEKSHHALLLAAKDPNKYYEFK